MEQFRIGDFICLKSINKFHTGRIIHKDINVFELSEILDRHVRIKGSPELIPADEIAAIPIDGINDKSIYYDPVLAAPIVPDGEPTPVRHRDRKYYFEKFTMCIDGEKNFQQLIQEQNCLFVHEVQHLLQDRYHNHGLVIDAI